MIRTCNSDETGNAYGIFVTKPIGKQLKRVRGHITMSLKNKLRGWDAD
jgi:hypothetical protein